MAFAVKLYKFEKKRNSTACPSSAPTGNFSGNIKEDFTPLAFSMTFDLGSVGNTQIPDYNYAYIENFKRYYYITDWVFVSGLWRASLTVDVLATYKEQILASRQFVARSAQAQAGGVIDTTYLTTGGSNQFTTDQTINPTSFWGAGYEDGTIVIGVICNSGLNIGSITYYAFSVPGYRILMSMLLDDISWAQISVSEISEELQKALINPAQYIVSSVWLPKNGIDFVLNSGAPASDIVSDIQIGWWSFSIAGGGAVARILHNPLTTLDYFVVRKYLEIDKHPQSVEIPNVQKARPWLQLSPYSRYTLTILPFGSFDLDTAELYNYSHLEIEIRVHSYTGDATLTLRACTDNQGSGGKVFCIMNANCGVPLPVGQIAINMSNMDSALTSAAIMGVTEIAKDISAPNVVTGSYEVKTKSKPSAHSTTTHRK